MSSGNPTPLLPAAPPMLRPAVGGRSAARTPRLGLAIPPSPNARPVGNISNASQADLAQVSSRPTPPTLKLATPMGSQVAPLEQVSRPFGGVQPGHSAGGGSESSTHSRSDSFGIDGKGSNPTSAGSQFSALSFASQYGIGVPRTQGTPDPVSAVGSMYSERSDGGAAMKRDGSLQGLDSFDKLSLEKVRTGDVEDLDDEGWRIASVENRIEEFGNLGEGAGGAVTKAKLKGGKTVFALKVGCILNEKPEGKTTVTVMLTRYAGHHHEP